MHYKLTVCRLSLFLTCFCRSPGPSALSLTGENNCHKYAPPSPLPPQYPPVQTNSLLHRHSFNTTALPNVL